MPQEQLALPLLVMLAQQRRYIAVQTQTGPLKLIAELYDKAQESLYLVRHACMSWLPYEHDSAECLVKRCTTVSQDAHSPGEDKVLSWQASCVSIAQFV